MTRSAESEILADLFNAIADANGKPKKAIRGIIERAMAHEDGAVRGAAARSLRAIWSRNGKHLLSKRLKVEENNYLVSVLENELRNWPCDYCGRDA